MNESIKRFTKKLFSILFRIFGAAFILSILFRINHYPYQYLLYFTGISGLLVTYAFWFIIHSKKATYNYLLLVFFLLWLSLRLLIALHIPYSFILSSISSASFLIWLFLYVFESSQRNWKSFFQNLPFVFAAIFIITGALFKINHFPGADIMMFLGVIFGLAWFIISMFGKKEQ